MCKEPSTNLGMLAPVGRITLRILDRSNYPEGGVGACKRRPTGDLPFLTADRQGCQPVKAAVPTFPDVTGLSSFPQNFLVYNELSGGYQSCDSWCEPSMPWSAKLLKSTSTPTQCVGFITSLNQAGMMTKTAKTTVSRNGARGLTLCQT